MQEKVLTPDQVAQILQVHQFTVLKYIKQGRIKASKIGRVYRIRQSDLELFLDITSGRVSTPTDTPSTPMAVNNTKKSKNKNKSSLNSQPADTLTSVDTDSKIESVSTTEVTVNQIETGVSNQQGGNDHYFILKSNKQ
ncbi:helix-turn-helix domain-containing protein [Candidatus Peregrinibacteria bacterium]|nr:helix-turn-helix domain-containing protein [Candidatus Peregrinibacteria bacterium]